jgi:hypothetical protein
VVAEHAVRGEREVVRTPRLRWRCAPDVDVLDFQAPAGGGDTAEIADRDCRDADAAGDAIARRDDVLGHDPALDDVSCAQRIAWRTPSGPGAPSRTP